MLTTHINKLLTDNKTLMLAYDQGLEHGPSTDFNLDNVDPDYIIEIAEKGGYNALILHNGVAEKYYHSLKTKLPLIIKLNGKTKIPKIEPFSAQVCSLKRAVNLGAHAVGYTLWVGSGHEPEIFSQFAKIVEEAHDYSIPVVMWAYPRGQYVPNPMATDILAYAARIGLELGADFVKIPYNNDIEGFKWVVKSAGKAKVVVEGGDIMPDRDFLQKANDVMQTGASGMVVGREIWKHKEPLIMTEAIKKILFEDATVDEAMKLFPNQ